MARVCAAPPSLPRKRAGTLAKRSPPVQGSEGWRCGSPAGVRQDGPLGPRGCWGGPDLGSGAVQRSLGRERSQTSIDRGWGRV